MLCCCCCNVVVVVICFVVVIIDVAVGFVFVVVLNGDIVVEATFKVVVVAVLVLVFIVVVYVVIVVVVDLNIDVVVRATSKVDLRILVMEVEFGWVGWWWVVCKVIFVSNPTQLSWGCDKN